MAFGSLTQLALVALAIGVVVLALVRMRAVDHRVLRIVPPDLPALDHLCRAAGVMLGSGPGALEVTLVLVNIPHLDDSGLASLEYWCRRWGQAGVSITLEACTRDVALAIRRRDLEVRVRRVG
jgi:hypothetical protein